MKSIIDCAIVNSKQSLIAFNKIVLITKNVNQKLQKMGCFLMQLSERLKETRKIKGKKQSDIAQLLNITRAAYGEYERGNNQPPIDKLVIIADHLNVSLDYLVGTTKKEKIDVLETLEVVKENLTTENVYISNQKINACTSAVLLSSVENIIDIIKIIERSVL